MSEGHLEVHLSYYAAIDMEKFHDKKEMRNKKSLRFKGTRTRPMMGKGLSPIEFENRKRPRLNRYGLCSHTAPPHSQSGGRSLQAALC